MEFDIGAEARCTDGSAGKVVALIADPVAKALAHIAVEPEDQPGNARVVPVDLVTASDAAGVELRCSLDELTRLPDFREVEFVPYLPDSGDLGATFALPYYSLPELERPILVDRVPAGEVGIRRHEHVHAADGAIGQVEGLVVDGESHITHVLLQAGHMWGRKEVAIPVGSLDRIDADGIHVQLSKSEIANLPELGVDPPWRREPG